MFSFCWKLFYGDILQICSPRKKSS